MYVRACEADEVVEEMEEVEDLWGERRHEKKISQEGMAGHNRQGMWVNGSGRQFN